MAQPKLQQEPTMEEILASIRRIIDSGEDAGRSPGYRSSQPRESAENRSDEARRSTGHGEENWYQRDEERPSEPVIMSRHHAADEPAVPEQSEPVRQEPPMAEQQVYRSEEAQAAPAEPAYREEASAEAPSEAGQPFQAVYPGTMGEVARQVRAASGQFDANEQQDSREAMGAAESEDDAPLLSAESEMRISEALRELSSALEREGARSIEEIVAEELRPLLSDWLETHMPAIVENVVARELERMRRR
ncbi:DUF2497 domain-containing protein [Martelella lutilitoris]|uniref:DUF2497 domain-containing protein n=1 Tax=Martelella lutilitoris TaxID=2583532 RepID=A0A5C4JNC4_9HYPH|nr:DUF2497 domain-containing protein [Martelella lutilitoris]TNB46682.1 DUF2497 domain-containing protein [Martelella lutilitoris]